MPTSIPTICGIINFGLLISLEPKLQRRSFDSIKKILSEDPINSVVWGMLDWLTGTFQPHDICKEIEFTGSILSEHAMNLDAWYYRHQLVWNLGNEYKHKDLDFTRNILLKDAKNKCAWNHRRSLLQTLGSDSRYDELNFTGDILSSDDARNEYAWFHRRQIAEGFPKEVQADLADKELQFSHDILLRDPENKYAWFHRRWVFQTVGTNVENKKLALTNWFLFADVKNSYAWYHRKWVLMAFGGWESELAFCDELLKDDICNGFAWNQRSFVVKIGSQDVSEDMRESEIKYAITAICENPENEFPWMHLNLLYRKCDFYDSIIDGVCLSILSDRIDGIKDLNNVFMDRRPYMNALHTVLELISHGYQASHKMGAVITELCSSCKLGVEITRPSSGGSVSGFVNCIG